ncbi:MAG: DUF4188 domain-containing protein [Proteobacteria bacterium]|nr:DUF4188 domain-containing protein [Pseudomonadota bacterium]
MYSVDFIFEPGACDDRFHELNAVIEAAAHATPGYLGVESWRSPDGCLRNAKYYWQSLEALRAFSNHPRHLEAKREYGKWYRGYHIIIAQVIKSYGDGAFAHFTPNEKERLT